jgi:hypothetical protein
LWCISTESPGLGPPLLLLLVLLPVVLAVVEPVVLVAPALDEVVVLPLAVVLASLPPVPGLPPPLLLEHAASAPAKKSTDAEAPAPSQPMTVRCIAHLA